MTTAIDAPSLLTTALVLIGVVGLLLLAGRLLRPAGFQPIQAGDRLLVARETLALDQRRRLHRVRCGRQDLLLLTGGPNDVVIGWVPPETGPPPS